MARIAAAAPVVLPVSLLIVTKVPGRAARGPDQPAHWDTELSQGGSNGPDEHMLGAVPGMMNPPCPRYHHSELAYDREVDGLCRWRGVGVAQLLGSELASLRRSGWSWVVAGVAVAVAVAVVVG